MTHLPFIAGAYGAFVVAALFAGVQAAWRLREAGRRLRAIDPRAAAR